jgi:hypothetical protein
MLTSDHNRLRLLDEFQIDPTLLKFLKTTERDLLGDADGPMDAGTFQMMQAGRKGRRRLTTGSTFGFEPRLMTVSNAERLQNAAGNEWVLTRLQRFLLWVIRVTSPSDRALVHRPLHDQPLSAGDPSLTVREFFTGLKGAKVDLAVIDGRVRGYESALKRAQEAGQTALVEQLTVGIDAARAETLLLAMGKSQVLEEATVVEFVKKCKRGLRLDWVANFTRVIPDDVLAVKREADQRGIFDNYAILHYDPEAKSYAETEAEKAARRDPILFGLIEGKRRLYYLGDWEDEFCDLTLDDIADVLGTDAVQDINPDEFPGVPR